MNKLVSIARTELRIGDVAHFYGARFEIVSVTESRSHIEGMGAYGEFSAFVGPSPVAVPMGRYIDGDIINGYFGPDKDWSFQGNALGTVAIEPRK